MKNRLLLLFFLALFATAHGLQAIAAPATTPAATSATPAASSPPPTAAQLGQQLKALVTGTSAPAVGTSTPALAAPIGTSAPVNNAATANNASSNEESEEITETTPTFGTRALNLLIAVADVLSVQGQAFVTNFAALPQLSGWFDLQRDDPHRTAHWVAVANDLLASVLPAFLGALLLEFSLYPLRRRFRENIRDSVGARFAALATLFLLRALPIVVFVGAAATLLDEAENQHFPRFIVLNIVNALALSRIVLAFLRGLFAPGRAALRFVPLSDQQAASGYRWLSAFSLVIIFGYFISDVARAIHVPAAAVSAFTNILGLVLLTMTVIVIARKRAFVAVLLRGQLSAAKPDLTMTQSLRLWLARYWHILAIAYLIIGYAVAALGVANGFALMLRGTALTLLIILAVRWLFGAVERWGDRDTAVSTNMHHAILRMMLRIVIGIVALVAVTAAWGADLPTLFATSLGQRLLGAIFSICVTIVIVALVYEWFSARVDRHLNRRDEESKALKASARTLTLLPMIRNTVFIGLACIVGLVVLSETGFNISPLLAGAGVVGVAVGFGSQTLIKDFLTGLFIVIENTIAIGDVVQVGTHSGVVETMNIRTMRIRDQNGSLHILPYSEVTQIVNMTRDFAFAVFNINVAYDTDLERAMAVIRSVGEELQKDPIYKRVILEPIEVSGVDNLGDYAITILARIRTRPGKQWDVKRMFLLRLKQRFDKEKIELPFPTAIRIQKPPQ